MIETPSLRTRVTWLTVVVVVTLVTALDLFVYLSLRERLQEALDEVLAVRVALVTELAASTTDLLLLDAELTERGVPAVMRAADGEVVLAEPATGRFDAVPPGRSPLAGSTESRTVPLAGGATAEVFVSRGGVDATLQRVLLVELIGSIIAVVFAAVLLRRASAVVTRPLDRMVATAQRIAAGDRTQRLSPSDPTTELGRMAAAFDGTIDALDVALRDSEEAERRSRRFLADAAHQLRTPLAGLRATAETLLDAPDGPDRDRLVANMARESTRMARLVDRLLRMARIDRGEDLRRERTDLLDVARREVARQRPLAPDLVMEVLVAEQPPPVSCDPEAVREALANLLDNARRFAGTTVTVTLDRGVGTAEVLVGDDGPGLAPADAETAFERFTSTTSGSGLGLAIARGIADAHGGELRWDGGAFRLSLPVAGIG